MQQLNKYLGDEDVFFERVPKNKLWLFYVARETTGSVHSSFLFEDYESTKKNGSATETPDRSFASSKARVAKNESRRVCPENVLSKKCGETEVCLWWWWLGEVG